MASPMGRACAGRRALAAVVGLSTGGTAVSGSYSAERNGRDGPRRWLLPVSSARLAVPKGAWVPNAVRCEAAPGPQVVREQLVYGTCKLRDGRLLAYHAEGVGVPVIAMHGMGSSRLTWLGERPLKETCPGVQLIAIDRPGYGGSTPPPFGYSYADFVRDLEELADHLKLRQFCVAGHSSGGPYALAAASLLPERVAACAAVCSDAPYYHPAAPRELVEADSFAQSALLSSDGLYGKDARKFAEGMRQSSLKKGVVSKAHAWKSGVDGFLCDYILERIPWSFAVESIALGPRLTIWVGSEDFEAIKVGSPFLQQLAPGSQLRVVEGGTHGFKSDPKHLAAILSELAQHC